MPKSQDPLVDENGNHSLNGWIAAAERKRREPNKQKNRGEQNESNGTS